MKLLPSILILTLMLGCQTEKKMKARQKQIIENYVNAYNNFDIERMTNDFDHNVVFENVSNGQVDLRTEGLSEFKIQAESAKQYFRIRKQTITNWDFNGSFASIEIDYEAILDTDLPNGMKSGDTLNLKGKSTFEFDNDKIVKLTDES
ncbi:MAG: nuclear transport factor 2 family protein [Cyclobacteriaceae bacterium]